MNTPPRPPRGYNILKLKILAAAVFRLSLHHRVDVLPDLALQENVVSHDVLDLDGVGPRVVEHLVEGRGVADEEVAELGRGRMVAEEVREHGVKRQVSEGTGFSTKLADFGVKSIAHVLACIAGIGEA